ncbi:MAG: nucleotidyltransferase [Bacteroidales bacterium]|nr:nucleotidyltransferase [Bacteroidales bacterium]
MKPALLVLAAGMGSRYGGLKQLDGVGPCGETIMDYSVFDAVRAGFGKVVFVIRKHFREDFERQIVSKYKNIIDVELVEQEMDKLPEGFTLNPEREKPWGTGHATLMAAEAIDTPFAVINADDFYGAQSFKVLADFLKEQEGETGKYSMVGFFLNKTLSESGEVSRGICSVNEEHYLTTVEEHHKVAEKNGTITGIGMDGESHVLDYNAYASMNMWGFTPDLFKYGKELFIDFLEENSNETKKEFYIPFIVNSLIGNGKASVKVLSSPDKWFGVTYKEDRPAVIEKLKEMTESGLYPSPLFQ